MILTTTVCRELTCEISVENAVGHFSGTLLYKGYDVGEITGSDMPSLELQFSTVAELICQGAHVRAGTIITNYYNRESAGDVLGLDGELLGSWACDDVEWFSFTEVDAAVTTCSAPSLSMLQDSIGYWLDEEAKNPSEDYIFTPTRR